MIDFWRLPLARKSSSCPQRWHKCYGQDLELVFLQQLQVLVGFINEECDTRGFWTHEYFLNKHIFKQMDHGLHVKAWFLIMQSQYFVSTFSILSPCKTGASYMGGGKVSETQGWRETWQAVALFVKNMWNSPVCSLLCTAWEMLDAISVNIVPIWNA